MTDALTLVCDGGRHVSCKEVAMARFPPAENPLTVRRRGSAPNLSSPCLIKYCSTSSTSSMAAGKGCLGA